MMEIFNIICSLIPQIIWPVIILILAYKIIKVLPDCLGAIGYKHLALMFSIKEYIYWLTDLVRRNADSTGKLSDEGTKEVYKILTGKGSSKYDLNNFVNQYKSYCPKLSEVKLTKINKKAKSVDEQREAIYLYYTNMNALIYTIMTDEYLKSREDLQQLSLSFGNMIDLIKQKQL